MTPPLDDSFHSCEAIGFHPGPCASYHLHDMTLNWLATAKMYLPIYLLPQLLFKMPAVRSRPLDVLVKVSTNIFNSGMMLACLNVVVQQKHHQRSNQTCGLLYFGKGKSMSSRFDRIYF